MDVKANTGIRAALLALAAAGACAACTSVQSGAQVAPSSAAPVTTITITESVAAGQTQGNANNTHRPTTKTTTKTTHPTTTTTTHADTGPKIVSFTVVQKPVCPITGTVDAPFTREARDVIIAWKVTGATGAAIAVDNPTVYGAYGEYEASGQLQLSFPCSGKTGQSTHKYTVWPKGAKSVSQTLTVSASNT